MQKEVKRGDIFYATLNGIIGSEQGGTRPVIIVQNDIGNYYSPTTIVVPLTTKLEMKMNQPTHYLLRKGNGLEYDSIVLTEQVRTIDKTRLKEKIGHLNNKIMEEIIHKLSIACGNEVLKDSL